MTPDALRTLARIHGVLAWGATAGLSAMAVVVLRKSPGRRRATAAGFVITTVLATSATGLAIHDPYRATLRQRLFLASPALGWLFERKQHAAFGATLLGLAALVTLLVLTRMERVARNTALARELRRTVALAWTAAALLTAAASLASTVVARHAHF